MKLSEILAELKTLKETLASFVGDKAKATAEALSTLTGKLTALETGAAAALAKSEADRETAEKKTREMEGQLETAQKETTRLGALLKETGEKLDAFLASVKTTVKEGATLPEKAALATKALTTVLAAQGIKAENLPAAEPNDSGKTAKSLSEQAAEITDPVKRAKFIAANQEKLDEEMRLRMKAAAKQ